MTRMDLIIHDPFCSRVSNLVSENFFAKIFYHSFTIIYLFVKMYFGRWIWNVKIIV